MGAVDGASPHTLHVWSQCTHVVFIMAAPLGKPCKRRHRTAACSMKRVSAISGHSTPGQDVSLAGTGICACDQRQQRSAEPTRSEATDACFRAQELGLL